MIIPYCPEEHDVNTVRWLNCPEIQQMFGISYPVDPDSHRAWMARQENTVFWAIVDSAGRHVGNTQLQIQRRHRSGYFQIYIGEPSARGQGLGEQALQAVLDYAFGAEKLHRVWLHVFPDNAPARKLYERVGFRLEGTLRESCVRCARGYSDQEVWGILDREYLP